MKSELISTSMRGNKAPLQKNKFSYKEKVKTTNSIYTNFSERQKLSRTMFGVQHIIYHSLFSTGILILIIKVP